MKLDIRDLGGGVIWTVQSAEGCYSCWSGFGLACCCSGGLALPLDFVGNLGSCGPVLPGALHAIAASRISFCLFQRLRTAFVSTVWSKKMPLAHVCAILSLLDGPPGCDPEFCVVGCRFRLLRRYLAYNPLEVPGLYSPLGLVAGGCPGHGPVHLLVESAGILDFTRDPLGSGWTGPGLPMLHHLAGPYQHFKAAISDAWRSKVCFDLGRRQGFRGGPMLDIAGSLQLLHASHVTERDQALLKSIMVEGRLEWISPLSCQGRNRSMPLLWRF